MQDAIIGLDIGTTCAKAVMLDLAGAELAADECAYPVHSPQPGWSEQNPMDVWRAALQVIKGIMERAGTVRPLALAVASQSGSLVLAAAGGEPVYPCITWMDGRSESLVNEWERQGHIPERVRRVSGWNIHPGLPLATLAWLRANNPRVCETAQRYLCINDFIVHQLTGCFCTNPSNAGVTQLLDVATATWSDELCALAGVHPGQFSPVVRAGALVGPITPAVSHATGLPPGMPVMNGGHDQSCTAVALGVLAPGQVLLACGTSWVVTGVVTQPDVQAIPAQLDLNFHALPGRWTVSQSLGGLGASLEWLVNQCWQDVPSREERYAAMDRELAQTRLGGDGLVFLPMAGGHAAPAGLQCGGFANVQLNHTRAHLARAVMEGAAFELRLALEQIRDAGMPVGELWMVGGATRSSAWPGIVADATGVPLYVTPSAHLPAVGAALLAGWGIGVFDGAGVGQAHPHPQRRVIRPDGGRQGAYDAFFARYNHTRVQYPSGDGG